MSANHGNTVAAWVGVAVMLAAFTVGAVGLLIDSWPTFWTAVGLLVVGPVAGIALQRMGYGQPR